MAIEQSHGIATCTSVPIHIPLAGQATLYRQTNALKWYVWNGIAWLTILVGDSTAYNAVTWDNNPDVATKGAIRNIIEAILSGAGLADGNYGDITVSGGGLIWTINAGLSASLIGSGVVTNAAFEHLVGVNMNIQPVLDKVLAYVPPMCYRILSSQFGVGTPSVILRTNTYGVTPVFIRFAAGAYELGIPANLFTVGFTTWQATLGDDAVARSIAVAMTAINKVTVRTYAANGNPVDVDGSFSLLLETFA